MDGNPLRDKAHRIMNSMGNRYVNRSDFVSALMISALSGLDFFALGTPGTAKSTIIKEFLYQHFDGNIFTATLDRTTVTSRLVGNIHPKKYMETGIEEHQTEGMIVEADMAFVDEIFKGAKGCREALLDILADRTWKTIGKEIQIPLLTMFSASNELPTDNEDAAFYSRLQIRVYVDDLSDSQSIATALWDEQPEVDAVRLSRQDILDARKQIMDITISHDAKEVILGKILPELSDLRVVLDQRKRNKAFGLRGSVIQTSAWLAGHSEVQMEDIMPARFAITGGPRDFSDIRQILLQYCTPAQAQRQSQLNEALEKAAAIAQHPEKYSDNDILSSVMELKGFSGDELDDNDRVSRIEYQRSLASLYLQRTGGAKG